MADNPFLSFCEAENACGNPVDLSGTALPLMSSIAHHILVLLSYISLDNLCL